MERWRASEDKNLADQGNTHRYVYTHTPYTWAHTYTYKLRRKATSVSIG